MMYKFRSKATGDLIMTQPVGDRVLSLMGKSPSAQGIIEVEQMPSAIAALESAAATEAPKAEGEEDAPKADSVSLRQRMWPMVEMMKRALSDKHPITWG